jgi:YD repeat-containing protein
MFNWRSKSKFMKQFRFPTSLIAMLATCLYTAAGQTNAPVVPSSGAVAKTRSAQPSNARANGPISKNVSRAVAAKSPRTAPGHPTQTVAQPPVNLRPNDSAPARPVDASSAAMNARQSAQTYDVQPSGDLTARNDVAPPTLSEPLTNAQRAPRSNDLQATTKISARENMTRSGDVIPDVSRNGRILQPRSDEPQTNETSREARHNRDGKKHRLTYSDASRRHRHEWHDRNWWKRNCDSIVFVNSAYYFLDAGYWYPAWGYDPLSSYYDYDGPIYTYGDLLPDQVIANVQGALQEAGYYFGPITGSLSVETRAALANFQRDYGLIITGAIDEPTVEALGLY